MSRLRAPSPSPLRRHPTTPLPARVQLHQPEPISRRGSSQWIPSPPATPSSSDRRFVSEEKHQEVVRLNAEYENHIRQFKDLLEDTRKKWSQAEEEIARLVALNEELRRKLGAAPSSSGGTPSKFNAAPSSSGGTPSKFSAALSSSGGTPSKFSAAPSSSGGTPSLDNLDKVNSRRHNFGTKRYFDEARCHACSLKICLGFESLKCTVCETVCHPNCRKDAPTCVPFFEPPKTLDGCLSLDEYCSDNFQPKLPHLIVRCVQYLNTKTSFKELYLDMSQDAKAEDLLDLILHDPNASNVSKFGPKVAAHCIIKFLQTLIEPLIPESFVIKFLKAVQFPEDAHLEKVVNNLPSVHKNVLAYLILHWKLLIQEGYSNGLTEEILGGAILPVIMGIPTCETTIYLSVFHRLLSLPSAFWCSAIDAAILKSPFDGNDGRLYARGAPRMLQQKKPKQERFGRLWG